MAIIECPSCKERISDKAKTCNHCNFSLINGKNEDGQTAEQIASKARLTRMKKRYALQMQAMLGIILFLAGIMLWYFIGNKGTTEISHLLQLGLAFSGGCLYLITRIRLIVFKRSD